MNDFYAGNFLYVSAHKLVLGLPWYGYRFNCTLLTKEGICVSTRKNWQCIRQSMNYGEISVLLSNSTGVQQWSDWYESPFMNYKVCLTVSVACLRRPQSFATFSCLID